MDVGTACLPCFVSSPVPTPRLDGQKPQAAAEAKADNSSPSKTVPPKKTSPPKGNKAHHRPYADMVIEVLQARGGAGEILLPPHPHLRIASRSTVHPACPQNVGRKTHKVGSKSHHGHSLMEIRKAIKAKCQEKGDTLPDNDKIFNKRTLEAVQHLIDSGIAEHGESPPSRGARPLGSSEPHRHFPVPLSQLTPTGRRPMVPATTTFRSPRITPRPPRARVRRRRLLRPRRVERA